MEYGPTGHKNMVAYKLDAIKIGQRLFRLIRNERCPIYKVYLRINFRTNPPYPIPIPTGVDFDAAGQLGVKVIWALSLPGKVAPVTAGRAIKNTIYNILCELGV